MACWRVENPYLCFTVFPVSLFQNGQTPLMVAAEQGNLEIVQELIRRGANVNLDDIVSVQMRTHNISNCSTCAVRGIVEAQVENNAVILTTSST